MKSSEEILKEKASIEIGLLKEDGFSTGNLERAMQAHTDATLDTLKERVEEMEKEAHDKYMKEYGSSDAEAFSAGRLEGISDVLQLIDEVRNDRD